MKVDRKREKERRDLTHLITVLYSKCFLSEIWAAFLLYTTFAARLRPPRVFKQLVKKIRALLPSLSDRKFFSLFRGNGSMFLMTYLG